ncbi:hypothetical protein QJS10_CPB04g00681 [Acorus calamus]|uniref:Disease resistance N-terminal domain-containing protein n=1 Tax=Acorus calamus TaxID=4465 RepID=A0AAV9EXP9_ACOCL|nr:hypothetical protein QJS10_CPB04g00681 [Acorus calamus]
MEEGLLGSLIVKIVSALAIEARGLARIREEMEKIKGMLEAMQPAFIGQVHRMGVIDEPAAIWVRQVKETALYIEDIIDEFVYLVDKHEGGIFGYLKKCTHRLKKETSLSRIFKELKDMIVLLEDIGKKKNQYDDGDKRGELSMTIDDTEIRRRRAEASQFVCDEEEDDVQNIKNKMPHLRTLMMFENYERNPKALKNIAIKTFRSLRVLDLEGLYSNESLPDAVGPPEGESDVSMNN